MLAGALGQCTHALVKARRRLLPSPSIDPWFLLLRVLPSASLAGGALCLTAMLEAGRSARARKLNAPHPYAYTKGGRQFYDPEKGFMLVEDKPTRKWYDER